MCFFFFLSFNLVCNTDWKALALFNLLSTVSNPLIFMNASYKYFFYSLICGGIFGGNFKVSYFKRESLRQIFNSIIDNCITMI